MQAGARLLENGYHFIKVVNVPRIQNGGSLGYSSRESSGCPWDTRPRKLMSQLRLCVTSAATLDISWAELPKCHRQDFHTKATASTGKELPQGNGEGFQRWVLVGRGQDVGGWTEGLLTPWTFVRG